MAVKNYLRDLAAKRYNTEKQKAKRAVDFGRSAFSVAKQVPQATIKTAKNFAKGKLGAGISSELEKTKYFKPVANKVRIRDFAREVPTGIDEAAKGAVRDVARFGISVAELPKTNKTGVASGKFYNTPVGRINSFQSEAQNRVMRGDSLLKAIGNPALETILAGSDLGTMQSSLRALKNTKIVPKELRNVVDDLTQPAFQQVTRNASKIREYGKGNVVNYKMVNGKLVGTPVMHKLAQPEVVRGTVTRNEATPVKSALFQKLAGKGGLSIEDVTKKRVPEDATEQGITKFGQRVVDDIGKGTAPLYNKVKDADIKNLVEGNLRMGKDSALKIARNTKLGAEANATAMGLMQDSLQKGDFDSFDLLLKEFSPRFSKQGQEISILRLWGKLTPTGAVKFADHLLEKLKIEGKLPQNHVFSKQAKQEIADLANKVQGLQSGTREHDIASALLMKRISEELPVNILRKISTGQTIAQLLNPKTLLRNIFGNAAYAGGELVSDVAAVPTDILTSAISGQRSKTLPSLGAFGKGLVKGAKEGFQEARLGIDTKNLPSQFDMPQGYAFKSKVGRTLEKALSIGLRTFDRAFYEAAHAKSLANSMMITGAKKPTLEMEEIAHYDALKATFQDESIPAIMFTKLKKDVLNVGKDWGLGDAVIKYPKTPGNILARALDYSPAGYAKAIMELAGPVFGKEFNQKAFVEALSRANVGSVGLVGVGAYLGKLGILTGEPNQDKDIRSLEAGQGAGQYRINASALKRLVLSWDTKQAQKKAGDTYISYDWLQPFAVPISMGVNAVQEEKKPYDQVAIDSLASGANTILEQPMVKGIQTLAGGYGDKLQGLRDVVQDIPASFTPGIINQVGQLTDNTKRSTYDPSYFQEATNKVMARFPLLREQLQPQYDVFGKPAEQYKDGGNNFWNVFLNPSFSSKFTEDPVAKEVLNIYHSTGEKKQAPRVAGKKIMIDGENYALPAESYAQYQKFIGEVTRWEFDKLMRDPTFNQLSDMEKANEMSRILTGIGQEARQELMKNGLAPMSMEEKAKSFLRAGDYSGYQEFVKQNPDINTMGDFKYLMSQIKTEMKPQEIIDIENKINRQKKKIQGYPFVR